MKPALTLFRNDSLIPDRACQHGWRLRSCGSSDCVALRESILKHASASARAAEPWPGSLGDIDVAIDLTEPSRAYVWPEQPPYADPRGLWKAIAVTFFFAALLIILGLYAAWVNL